MLLCVFHEENAKTLSTMQGDYSGTRGGCKQKQADSSNMDPGLTFGKEKGKTKIGLAEAWATVRFSQCSVWSDGGCELVTRLRNPCHMVKSVDWCIMRSTTGP